MQNISLRVALLLLSPFVVVAFAGCDGSDSDGSSPTVVPEGEPAAGEPPEGGVSTASSSPNLLLIIADDQGLDASAQYALSDDVPATPVIDSLAANGIVFDNAWATPSCTTTRGTLITGMHGVNSGVETVPDLMDPASLTLQRYLGGQEDTSSYTSAVVGKWHLAGGNPSDLLHPITSGVDYYAGTITGTIQDYNDWPLTTEGVTTQSLTYHTTAMTDLAIDWMQLQESPWFLWLAYVSPHSPFHLPPADLHSRPLTGDAGDISANPRDYYLAAIEAMDTEIGRLLDSMSAETRDNTVIVYIGDNGTPTRVIDAAAYPASHGKGSLYEGGIRVPMVVSGAGVTRQGEREPALINSTDLFATFAELAGAPVPDGLDSVSFAGVLDGTGSAQRSFNYSEFVDESTTGWVVRDESLKLIEFADGSQEVYDLLADPREETNLISDSSIDGDRLAALANFAAEVRTDTASGNEGDVSSSNGVIDITNAVLEEQSPNCVTYANAYSANATDIATSTAFDARLQVMLEGDRCEFSSNAIPNHDFNDGQRAFANPVAEQSNTYSIPATPEIATESTPLSLTIDNAILLNGVKVDLLAAACFGVGDERVGCNDPEQPWRFDPMHIPNGFRVDSHNAHTQPDGTYHYHGLPNALYREDSDTGSPVVGFAADGFPIYGSVIDEGDGVRNAQSSYRLKTGARPTGDGQPGGDYNGTYRDDYEFVEGLGVLDECNGRMLEGQYRYHLTDSYPYVIGCFRGQPDSSFIKRNG